MNTEIKAKWLEALRSGKFSQTHGALYYDGNLGPKGYCCLGVLCEVITGHHPTEADELTVSAHLNSTLADQAGIDMDTQYKLGQMNDGSCGERKHNFLELADYIEKNL